MLMVVLDLFPAGIKSVMMRALVRAFLKIIDSGTFHSLAWMGNWCKCFLFGGGASIDLVYQQQIIFFKK